MRSLFSKLTNIKHLVIVAVMVVVAGFGFSTAHAACLSNDKANDIIECGFTNAADFAKKAKVNASPGNDLDNIFSHYGLTPSEYDRFASSAKAGKVSTNGNVTVNGKVVGTNAKSLGRKAKTKSTPVTIDGKTYHESNIGDVTTVDNDVTVLFDSAGQVEFIVMNICGNPIRVTQKEKPAPAVTITKTVDGQKQKTVNVNTNFTYKIVVENTGNVDLKDVVVTDTPEAGVTLVSKQVGTITNNVWKHTLATLKVGEKKEFTLTAKIPTYKSGTIKNTVCVETPTIPGTNPDDCDDATVDVPEPKTVRVCEISTGNIITVDESKQHDSNYAPEGSEKCKIKVCDTSNNTVVTIDKSVYEADKERYTTDLERCNTPVTPPTKEIPSTGPTEIVMGMMGAGSLAGAGYYWRASRREMIKKILG